LNCGGLKKKRPARKEIKGKISHGRAVRKGK